MLRPSLPSLLAPPGGFSLSVTYRRLLEPHSEASTLPDATRSSIPQYYLLFSVPSFPSITFSPAGFTANSEGQVTSRANLHVRLSGARKKRRRRDPPFGCSGLNPPVAAQDAATANGSWQSSESRPSSDQLLES